MTRFTKLFLSLTVAILAAGLVSAQVQGLNPDQAYEYVRDYDNAYIIDVRIPAEYFWVGHPGVNLADDPESGFLEGRVFHIPYKLWDYDKKEDAYVMTISRSFARDVVRQFPRGSILIFICRSGGRSAQAQEYLMDPANSNRWMYSKIQTYEMYNLDEGFEGGRDPVTGHRTVAGWRYRGLPYIDGAAGIWAPKRHHHDDHDSDSSDD